MPREAWIEFVRVVAAFLVVLLHCAAPWLWQYGKVPGRDWMGANAVDSFTRACVPLFFMITGHLLVRRPVALGDYFRRRVSRIVIPWIAWSAFYLLWSAFYKGEPTTLGTAVRSFLSGKVYYHLWFFYALAGLYLLVPVLSWFLDRDGRERAKYFVACWFVAASLLPLAARALGQGTAVDEKVALSLAMFSGYSGYLVLGFLLGRLETGPGLRLGAAAVFAACVGLLAVSTSLFTSRAGFYSPNLSGYLSPVVVVASVALFCLLRETGMRLTAGGGTPWLEPAVARASAASLGIYLVHPVFIDLLRDGRLGGALQGFARDSALTIPALSLLVFALSWGVAEILLRVPYLRRTI